MNKERLEEVKKKAYELGYKYEQEYRGCGQCLLGAISDALDYDMGVAFKAATAFAGGVGLSQRSGCGAFLGGCMFVSMLKGREKDRFDDPERVRFESFRIADRLSDKFIAEYGSANCDEIQKVTIGRPYDLRIPEEMAAFDDAGGHFDKCPSVVGQAAVWILDIAYEEGLLDDLD